MCLESDCCAYSLFHVKHYSVIPRYKPAKPLNHNLYTYLGYIEITPYRASQAVSRSSLQGISGVSVGYILSAVYRQCTDTAPNHLDWYRYQSLIHPDTGIVRPCVNYPPCTCSSAYLVHDTGMVWVWWV